MSPRVKAILAEVSEERGVPVEALLGPSRARRVAHPRQEAMVRIRDLKRPDGTTAFSYPRIGQVFSRDHTTIIHGVRSWEGRA